MTTSTDQSVSKSASNKELSSVLENVVDQEELQERFACVIFLLGQFNAHYLSWLKNPNHLSLYWQRFTPFYELLRTLPEFCGLSPSLNESTKWVLCEAMKEAMQYRRMLLVRLSNVSGVRYYVTGKKFHVLLVENRQADAESEQIDEPEGEPKLATDPMGRKVLGELELTEGATEYFTLPVSDYWQ